MKQPLISVVITCYNYERYVGAAVQSAVTQAYPDKEIIVINDGSTDDSLAVIQRFAQRVLIIDEQVNKGHIAAFNRGFAASSGDVVMFLDSDDYLEPGALEEVARLWSPTCSKVQFDLRIIDADGRDLGRRFCHFTPDYDSRRVRSSFERTGTYRWPVTSGNAYARWFLERLFPLHVEHGPDGMLNTVAPVYGDVRTVPRVLGAYRIHGANMWSSNGNDNARLPARIRDRRQEVACMREHAAQRGVTVPDVDPLDHELPFINYRLMALKLGLDYPGKDKDTPGRLLRQAWQVLRHEKLPPRITATHLAWFVVLAPAPRSLAAALIRWRFNRAQVAAAVRRSLSLAPARMPAGPRAGGR